MVEKISEDKYFWTKDGRSIKNLHELLIELKYMSEGTFFHHVSHEKNDFANWIRDVLDDSYLANKLHGLVFKKGYILFGDWYHRKAMISLIKKRIKELKQAETRFGITSEGEITKTDYTYKWVLKVKRFLDEGHLDKLTSKAKNLMKKVSLWKRKQPMRDKLPDISYESYNFGDNTNFGRYP